MCAEDILDMHHTTHTEDDPVPPHGVAKDNTKLLLCHTEGDCHGRRISTQEVHGLQVSQLGTQMHGALLSLITVTFPATQRTHAFPWKSRLKDVPDIGRDREAEQRGSDSERNYERYDSMHDKFMKGSCLQV